MQSKPLKNFWFKPCSNISFLQKKKKKICVNPNCRTGGNLEYISELIFDEIPGGCFEANSGRAPEDSSGGVFERISRNFLKGTGR